MQVPVRMMAFCSSKGEWFTLDATLASGHMTFREARRVESSEVASAKSMWQGPALGQVSIDASKFVCPCCGGANRIAEVVMCPGCSVFSCSGLGTDGRLKGPCGKCSWDRDQIGPPVETFEAKAAVRM